MNIAANKISPEVMYDMIEIFESQEWLNEFVGELIELWNVCEFRQEQTLLKSLIMDICLFNAAMERLAHSSINEKMQSWGLSPKSTWIVAVANKTEIDGSTAALQRLKNKILPFDNWHSRFISNIPEAAQFIKAGQSVVLFDDFIGSGDKMIKKGRWLRGILDEKGVGHVDVYYLSLAAMRFGMEKIRAETRCEAYAYKELTKAITDKFDASEAARLIEVMTVLESRLFDRYKNKKIEDYSLGYGRSEALYCAENDNCPNNVFPVFWWTKLKDGRGFRTLFKRAG